LDCKKFRNIKPEIRVLGVDDGAFVPHTRGLVVIIGVVFRGGYWLDGVMHTKIEIDGLDATNKIARMIINSPHYRQLRVIMLNGITFAGFNVVDIKKLYDRTKLPIIVVSQKKPNFEEIREAIKNLSKNEERWRAIKNAGEITEIQARDHKNEKIYIQTHGILPTDAVKIVRSTSTRSNIPEALRVAHLIASGISST